MGFWIGILAGAVVVPTGALLYREKEALGAPPGGGCTDASPGLRYSRRPTPTRV